MISIDNIFENLKEIRLLEDKLYHLELNGWLKNEFLIWEWWILVVFLVVPWVIWAKLVKRDIILEILLFGTIIILTTTLLDVFVCNIVFGITPLHSYLLFPGPFLLIFQWYL